MDNNKIKRGHLVVVLDSREGEDYHKDRDRFTGKVGYVESVTRDGLALVSFNETTRFTFETEELKKLQL